MSKNSEDKTFCLQNYCQATFVGLIQSLPRNVTVTGKIDPISFPASQYAIEIKYGTIKMTFQGDPKKGWMCSENTTVKPFFSEMIDIDNLLQRRFLTTKEVALAICSLPVQHDSLVSSGPNIQFLMSSLGNLQDVVTEQEATILISQSRDTLKIEKPAFFNLLPNQNKKFHSRVNFYNDYWFVIRFKIECNFPNWRHDRYQPTEIPPLSRCSTDSDPFTLDAFKDMNDAESKEIVRFILPSGTILCMNHASLVHSWKSMEPSYSLCKREYSFAQKSNKCQPFFKIMGDAEYYLTENGKKLVEKEPTNSVFELKKLQVIQKTKWHRLTEEPWSADTDYKENDIVKHDDRTWVSVGTILISNMTPKQVSLFWSKSPISFQPPAGVRAWEAGVDYFIGDQVIMKNRHFTATSNVIVSVFKPRPESSLWKPIVLVSGKDPGRFLDVYLPIIKTDPKLRTGGLNLTSEEIEKIEKDRALCANLKKQDCFQMFRSPLEQTACWKSGSCLNRYAKEILIHTFHKLPLYFKIRAPEQKQAMQIEIVEYELIYNDISFFKGFPKSGWFNATGTKAHTLLEMCEILSLKIASQSESNLVLVAKSATKPRNRVPEWFWKTSPVDQKIEVQTPSSLQNNASLKVIETVVEQEKYVRLTTEWRQRTQLEPVLHPPISKEKLLGLEGLFMKPLQEAPSNSITEIHFPEEEEEEDTIAYYTRLDLDFAMKGFQYQIFRSPPSTIEKGYVLKHPKRDKEVYLSASSVELQRKMTEKYGGRVAFTCVPSHPGMLRFPYKKVLHLKTKKYVTLYDLVMF